MQKIAEAAPSVIDAPAVDLALVDRSEKKVLAVTGSPTPPSPRGRRGRSQRRKNSKMDIRVKFFDVHAGEVPGRPMDEEKEPEKIDCCVGSLPANITGNFSKTTEVAKFDLASPLDKPLSIGPPLTLGDARRSPWWPQYKAGMTVEFDGHIENETWIVVPRSRMPRGTNLIRGKWVFDDKRGEDGKILKFKARYVACGYSQKPGIDYGETFAGVVVVKTFRIMLVILNEDPTFEMEHWDVKMAFTVAPLEETLYMAEPEGYETGAKGENVCLLKKSLYGLKQSARNWQKLLEKYFFDAGFSRSRADPCLYFKIVPAQGFCLITTHVDDIFVLYDKKGKNHCEVLRKKIFSEIKVENLGPVSWALKTAILRDRQNGILKISQEQFTLEFLEKVKNPTPKKQFFSPNWPENQPFCEKLDKVDESLKNGFQKDIGSFWWLANISRPDIFYAVHRCAKLINIPTPRLGQRIQRIKDYLSTTPSLGITFSRTADPPVLSGYVDAAFAAEDDFKSRVGYFYLFKGNLVSWASENPTRKLSSSTEAECRGLVHFSKENQWHRQFHEELGLFDTSTPTTVYEDNTASIALASNLGTPHKKSKHFGIEWAIFKEAVELKELALFHVSTEDQPADMLTKSLMTKKFFEFRDSVMGSSEKQEHFNEKILAAKAIAF